MAQKAKMAILWPYEGPGALNRWNSVKQGWKKLGHTRGDAMEPFPGSGMTIGGRYKPSKWLKRAKMTIVWPGVILGVITSSLAQTFTPVPFS